MHALKMSGVSLMDKRLVCLINHYVTEDHQVHDFEKGVQCIVTERFGVRGREVREGPTPGPGVSGES
jgi:hypothetical protein